MTVRFRRTPIRWGLLPLVVAGGALGVAARAVLMTGADDPLVELPIVFLINALGSGLLGLLVGWAGERPRLRAFLGTGALGGFTSYSALAPGLALVVTGTLPAGSQAGPLATGVTVVLLAVGGVLVFVALPVGIAAIGVAIGSRAAGRGHARGGGPR